VNISNEDRRPFHLEQGLAQSSDTALELRVVAVPNRIDVRAADKPLKNFE
jgi:hypothetical protein